MQVTRNPLNLYYCTRNYLPRVQVIDGMDIVRQMEACGTRDGKPTKPVEIVDCGELS